MSRRGLAFAFALFLFLSMPHATPLSDCGSLDSNTYYEVTQNLNTGNSQTPCLVINGKSNVAVNLNGYTVRGIEVKNFSNNITIENGTLGPVATFAYLKIDISNSSNVTVKNITHYAYCIYPGCLGNRVADSQDIYFYNITSTMPSYMRGSDNNFFLSVENTKNAKFEKLSYNASDNFSMCNLPSKWRAVDVDNGLSKTSTNITFKNSYFGGMCDGIGSWAENLTIYNNVFDVQDVAIRIRYCNNNITENMGKNSLYSIVYMEHNTSQSYSPGTISGLIFCNVTNFQVTGPTAIYGLIQLVNSTNNTFNNFSVMNNYRAIVLDSSKDNRFYNAEINNTIYGAVFYTTDSITSIGNSFENISAFNVSDRLIGSCGGGGECVCNVSVRNVSLNSLPVWFNTTTNNITVSNVNLGELTFCDVENSTVSNVNITNGTGFWSYSSANILVENVNFSRAHLHNLYSYLDDNVTIRNSDLSYHSTVPAGGWQHSIKFAKVQNITINNITSYETNGFGVFGGTNFNIFNSKIKDTYYGRCYYCKSCLDLSGRNFWVENNTVISYQNDYISGIKFGMYPGMGANLTAQNNFVGASYYGISIYTSSNFFPSGGNDKINITNNTIQNASIGLYIESNTNITEVSFNLIENKKAPYGSSSGIMSKGESNRGLNVSIFNNTIYNASKGYYAYYGIRDWLYNNTICNVKTVFYLFHSTEITIGNNSICDDIYTPIIVISDNSTECTHEVNISINDTNPVYFSNNDDVVFENNDTIAQIFLCNVSRARIQNITMRRENLQYGIWSVLTRYSNITDFRCYNMNTDNYCLNLQHMNFENRLRDSSLANNTKAVFISATSNTTYIYNNTFQNNNYSIWVEGFLNSIYNNSFNNATFADVYVYGTSAYSENVSNNTFVENVNNANAFRIFNSQNNTFEWNNVSGASSKLIHTFGYASSLNNTFRFNTINGSGANTGFYDSVNTSTYHNNTISNLRYGIYFECPSVVIQLTSFVYHNFFYNITNYYVFWGDCHLIHLNTSASGVAQGNYYDDILSYSIYDSDDNSYCDYGTQYPYANPPTPKLPGTPNWKDWGPIILGGIYDHPDGINESAYSALYLNKYIYDLERHYTTSLIRYNHSTQGLRLAVTGRFHFGDVNMSNASVYTGALPTGGNYTVVNATSATGIESAISLFVPNFLNKGVFVCPNAEEPSQLVYNCDNYTAFSIAEAQAGTQKNGITVNLTTFLGQEYYNITHAQKRGGAGENIGSNLTVWDTSDNETICPEENITFFANYSNATSGEPILDADCNISFEDGVSAMMWYNSSSLFYEYNRTFDAPGIYYYNVTCNATDYPTAFEEDYAQVFICGTYLYGANVTVINISKYNYTYEVGRYALKPGNITQINIDMNVSTEKWAGFYGNVSNGTYLVLGDATGNAMYAWPWQGEEGKGKAVCTSTNGSLYFINLTAALGSEIDTAWGFLPSTADSGMNTFNQQCNITFGTYTIQNAACRPTGYSNFYTRALKIYPWLGYKDEMVFCTNITSATSFVDTPVDFELIVPTNYTMDTVETYYFYISIE